MDTSVNLSTYSCCLKWIELVELTILPSFPYVILQTFSEKSTRTWKFLSELEDALVLSHFYRKGKVSFEVKMEWKGRFWRATQNIMATISRISQSSANFLSLIFLVYSACCKRRRSLIKKISNVLEKIGILISTIKRQTLQYHYYPVAHSN